MTWPDVVALGLMLVAVVLISRFSRSTHSDVLDVLSESRKAGEWRVTKKRTATTTPSPPKEGSGT